MKNEFAAWVLALLIFPLFQAACQNTAPGAASADIEISPATLKTADWANFKYKDVLEKAKTGDAKALKDFLDFHGAVDGTDALGHSVSCLELIPVAGDYKFALAVQNSKPKLKELLRERLVLAQGRTKKTALQQPLDQWAPNTFAALNGKPLPTAPPSPTGAEGLKKATDAAMLPPKPGAPADASTPAKEQPAAEQVPNTRGAAPVQPQKDEKKSDH